MRAAEKLAAKNKILRKENEGLRSAIFKEKRKRKRKKALNFYNKGEKEEAEIHQKRTLQDKKLQAAIAREEKIKETAEKKA